MNKLKYLFKFFIHGIIFYSMILTFQQLKLYAPYYYIRGLFFMTQSLNYSKDECVIKVLNLLEKEYPDANLNENSDLPSRVRFQCTGNIYNKHHNPYMAIACMHSEHWHE